jgi:DnaJ family protein B protein 4
MFSQNNEESHYTTLGIAETASPEEIKKAYRSLSLKYHPDKNPSGQEMFQKISSAFEVLGDTEKKKEYDFMKNHKGFPSGMDDMGDINDLLSSLFGGMPGGIRVAHMGMPGMGGFSTMGGFHSFNPPHQGANIHMFRNGIPVQQKPPTIIHNLTIEINQVLNGIQLPIDIERWIIENNLKVHEKQTIYIDIPKGIDDGEIIVLQNQGNVVDDNCKGDVKIHIKVNNNSIFERRGLDLYVEKQISLKESLCGFSFELKYLNDKVYTINNQIGNIIPPDYKKVIPGMGLSREKAKGNLIINFKIQFPSSLSQEQIDKLNELF